VRTRAEHFSAKCKRAEFEKGFAGCRSYTHRFDRVSDLGPLERCCLAQISFEISITISRTKQGYCLYIAAYGGLQFIQFNPDGTVFVDPVICGVETRRELNRHLLLFFTGILRDAHDVLSRQKAGTERAVPALQRLSQIARDMREVLICGRDLNEFGGLLHDAWKIKKSIEWRVTNP
jgi:galactokinase/mevalonate kinase-like predicted kinase